jgi:hypothetical protein
MAAPNLNAMILGSRTITAALTDVVLTEGTSAAGSSQAFWDRFAGINALSVEALFTYGSGGTTAILRIDTALGSGGVWRNIARIDFATASLVRAFTISRTALPLTTIAELGSESLVNFLGDRFRARLTTTGTYAGNTLLDVRAQPHA